MIYCVEDERNIRELLVYTLHSTGFTAKGLENGEQLYEALEKEIPELILLDIMMPGEDGYTVLEKIKAMPEVKDVPVIMVTAKGAEFDKVKGLDMGADDYITEALWNDGIYIPGESGAPAGRAENGGRAGAWPYTVEDQTS